MTASKPSPPKPTREIYASAPLRFVALELQFDLVPTLATEGGRALIYERLRDDFPIADAAAAFEVTVGPLGSSPPQAAPGLRMTNRDRTRSVTVLTTSLTIEASVFHDSDEFFATADQAVRAIAEARVATIKRVGLRYIDEIRVTGVTESDQWQRYIDERLIAGIEFAGAYTVKRATGVLALEVDQHHRVMMRFGPQDGFAVDPNGPLRLPPAPQGHFFLLDFDSFWLPGPDGSEEFSSEKVMDICLRLDDPPHELFEAAVTDRLRDEVFRKEAHAEH